ncbi:MAG: efflux RND transporter permease subunit, partial [Steroidobacteraceae bacterium]
MLFHLRHNITHKLHQAEEWLFANPKTVLGIILAFTLGFALCVPKLRIYSDFADLLPQKHPYIQTYNRIKENFGGANLVIVAIEVDQGTIFNPDTLRLIHETTQAVDNVDGVNHNLVSSLTHRTVRKVFLDESGSLTSRPYYDPLSPPDSQDAYLRLQQDVASNPQVYGLLVSPDFRAALIKAQLNEANIDYVKTFAGLQAARDKAQGPGHKVYMTGNPVLTGWVYTYLTQIVWILALTLGLLTLLLIVYFRRLYGIALPLIGIVLSTIWGLGFMALMGINLEPLSLPIPFLIAARATSHGVQLVSRYYEELEIVGDGKRAARNSLDALFRPGSLAIIVDALGIFILVLGTAPFNHKLGLAAGFWGLSVIFTVHFMVPLALTVLPKPKHNENKNQSIRNFLRRLMAATG